MTAASSPFRRAFLNRHPGDVLRLGLGLAILLTTATFVRSDSVGKVETNVFRLINDFPLPGWFYPVVWTLMQIGNIASVPATALAAGVARRWRLALDFAVAGGTIYLLAKLVKTPWSGDGRRRCSTRCTSWASPIAAWARCPGTRR